ncbi:MAG: hypothetical protein ACHQT7_00470 [Candidatus Levyibacteriota bacterium]
MACAVNEVATELGCFPNDPVGFIQKFYGVGLSLIGGVGLLFLIYGGYQVMISGGNPEKLQKGKEYIMYAIIGIMLAVLGFVFIQFIAGGILRIPGFG